MSEPTPDPKLKLEFVLDEKGEPLKIESGGVPHYEIKVSVENAPKDAYGVTYRLHSSYFDPVREVLDTADDFSEQFTTFGDYRLNARVRTDTGSHTLRESVAEGLTRTYSDSQVSAPIAEALQSIKSR